jgi:hypothetical protein
MEAGTQEPSPFQSEDFTMTAYGRKAWDVVAWTYDADIHCPDCAGKRFKSSGGFDWTDENAGTVDSEGNVPHPVFACDEYEGEHCGDCFDSII